MNRTGTRLGLAAAALSLAATAAAAQATQTAAATRAPGDTTCLACRDFYRFANQKWLDSASIPAAYPSW